MSQNFEQNLTQAIQEVVTSIDPNYTFDNERNCYVAHDKERDDSVITFTYENRSLTFSDTKTQVYLLLQVYSMTLLYYLTKTHSKI